MSIIDRAYKLQNEIEFKINNWIKRIGLGYIVGLFSFSLIALSLVEIYYYTTIKHNAFIYFISGDETGNIKIYLNPLHHLVMGFIILFILLLIKRESYR